MCLCVSESVCVNLYNDTGMTLVLQGEGDYEQRWKVTNYIYSRYCN